MSKPNFRNQPAQADAGRKFKKRISPLSAEDNSYVDYKDVDLLRKFISERAKIRTRRVTGNNSQQQKEIARAIKNAREMGLIAYTSRVTTKKNRRDDRRDNRDSSDKQSESRNNDSQPKSSSPDDTKSPETITEEG